ncbi:Hypothetical predicted protein [Prunus dulcis]|uniref:Uncharacterized protein n=1 Tax=Prunus dulcis TaxID=3755 RepID=A0A5E4GAE6_PRUDU|nr:hypothetical protein L3X38_009750 [Prunus dulcis]VVA36568.1 Hypothetical predicted protein [Prunus dulcis]
MALGFALQLNPDLHYHLIRICITNGSRKSTTNTGPFDCAIGTHWLPVTTISTHSVDTSIATASRPDINARFMSTSVARQEMPTASAGASASSSNSRFVTSELALSDFGAEPLVDDSHQRPFDNQYPLTHSLTSTNSSKRKLNVMLKSNYQS